MDFNQYAKNGGKKSEETKQNAYDMDNNLFNLVNAIAGEYNGKSQTELLKAIYEEAKKGMFFVA